MGMSESRTFREAWRLVSLVVFAFVIGWLAWYLHSLSGVAFWVALLVANVLILVGDWLRLSH
jgi:hypothetical protein